MSCIGLEEKFRSILASHGVLDIASAKRGGNIIYSIQLVPKVNIVQSSIAVVCSEAEARITGGMVFNFRDVPEEIASEVRKIVSEVAEKYDMYLTEVIENLYLEKKVEPSRVVEEVAQMALALDELNKIFDKHETIRNLCYEKGSFRDVPIWYHGSKNY